jgi:hypothetical protein
MSRSSSPKRRRSTKEADRNANPASSGYCDRTDKLKYGSRSQAKSQVKRVKREQSRKSNKRLQTRVYECGFCHSWHTTSQALAVSEAYDQAARARQRRKQEAA